MQPAERSPAGQATGRPWDRAPLARSTPSTIAGEPLMAPGARAARGPRRSRRGVALVMAIVILAALLLLGLPFLMSQSTSLAGSRAFQDAQRAGLGVDTATRIAAAVAVKAVEAQLRPVPDDSAQQTAAPSTTTATKTNPYVSRFDSKTLEELWSSGSDTAGGAAAGAGNRSSLRFVDDKDLRLDAGPSQPPIAPPGRFTYIQFDNLLPNAFDRTAALGAVVTRPSTTLIGATIEDESGKLNPNCMSVAAWDGLLKAVFGTWREKTPPAYLSQHLQKTLPKGQTLKTFTDAYEFLQDDPSEVGKPTEYSMDWDDNRVLHGRIDAHRRRQQTSYYVENDDSDHWGQLARALAELPAKLPGGVLNDLDQLLLADTIYWKEQNQGRLSTKSQEFSAPQYYSFGLRRPLTRSELDRLRPYLTVHSPRPGRDGLTDFGTVVAADGTDKLFWDAPEWSTRLYGWSVGLRFHPLGNLQSITGAEIIPNWSWWMSNRRWFCDWGAGNTPAQNAAIGMLIHPAVNLFSASRPVLRALGITRLDHTTDPPTGLEDLTDAFKADAHPLELFKKIVAGSDTYIPSEIIQNSNPSVSINQYPTGRSITAWHLQEVNRTHERVWDRGNNTWDLAVNLPPVGWVSAGVVAISSVGTATDPQGRQSTHRQRRSIIQAVPQERPVEARWTDQVEMAELVGRHSGSNVETWPNPINRIAPDVYSSTATNNPVKAWPAYVAKASSSPGSTTPPAAASSINDKQAIRPEPMPSLATGCFYRDHKWPFFRIPTHLSPYSVDRSSNGYKGQPTSPQLPNIDWCVDFGAAAPIRLENGYAEDATWPKTFIGPAKNTVIPNDGSLDRRA